MRVPPRHAERNRGRVGRRTMGRRRIFGRRAACRRTRVVYRRRSVPLDLVLTALVSAAVTAGLLTGYLALSLAAAGLLVLGWSAYTLRIVRMIPAGPRGD